MDAMTSLKVFATVAELRSFTAAADRLSLSPAMASKHLQSLEARLGARLLNRTSRSVSLTEAGALYLDRVRPLLEGLDEAEARLSQTTVNPRGTLKLSLPVWMAGPSFARIIAAYRVRYPDVMFDLDLSGKRVNLVEDGYDVALRVTFSLDEGLIAKKLMDVSFLLVGSPELLARLGEPKSLSDLQGAPFLAYSPVASTGRVRFGQGAAAEEVQFLNVVQSTNENLLYYAAREGVGLAMMPHPLVAADLASGALCRVLPDAPPPTAPLYAVYADRSYLPAKVRSFLDFIAAPDGLIAFG